MLKTVMLAASVLLGSASLVTAQMLPPPLPPPVIGGGGGGGVAGGGGGGGSALGAGLAYGLVGTVAILTAFSPQGWFTKLVRPGGFRCQLKDIDFVPGCEEYVRSRGIKIPAIRDTNAIIAMKRIANLR